MQRFSGIWVPLITPFGVDGSLDLHSLRKLTQQLAPTGIAGWVVCGTTGESDTLSDEEKAQVLATVLDAGGDLPVVMGVKGITPDDVAAQCQRWQHPRIQGFMVPPPSYVRPSQQGVVNFFAAVAQAAAPRAVIVYDIPYRTGLTLTLDTLRALARLAGVRGLKDCGGDASKTQALMADGQLDVLAGEDAAIFTTLCQGGAGAIAAAAHLHTRRFVAMHRAVSEQRLHDARAAHHALAPMIAALFAEPNPAPLKAVLAAQGVIDHATVRAPMTEASAQATQAALLGFDATGDRG